MEDLKLSDTLFCVVDFETTGTDWFKDQIIEIGAVKIKNLQITDKFHCIVNPLKIIPYKITIITGITNDMVQGQPTIDEIKDNFLNFIKNSIWVEHSSNWFDFNFFIKSFDFKGKILRISTFQMAKKLLNLKKYDLSNVVKKLEINFSYNRDKHKALEDATLTAEVFIKLCSILPQQTINYMKKEGFLDEYKS